MSLLRQWDTVLVPYPTVENPHGRVSTARQLALKRKVREVFGL